MVLASLTGYGQHAVGDTFNTFTGGGPKTIARYVVTSTNPKTVKLVEYIGDNGVVQTDVTIPQVVIGYTITAIGKDAFKEKGLTSVIIPNSVTHIGSHAFAYNELSALTIPGNVTSIGNYAFAYNQLTQVDLREGLTSIGEGAFRNNNLIEVILPSSVTSIGAIAFYSNITYNSNPNLAMVEVKSINPPSLNTLVLNPFGNTNDRSKIDLVVPRGTIQAYLANGWTHFRIHNGSCRDRGHVQCRSYNIPDYFYRTQPQYGHGNRL